MTTAPNSSVLYKIHAIALPVSSIMTMPVEICDTIISLKSRGTHEPQGRLQPFRYDEQLDDG
jgi:hypothetical protein